MHVHLGLYGTFAGPRRRRREVPAPSGQVRLRLVADGATARRGTAYADLRGATRCALVTPPSARRCSTGSGPDPLKPDADPDRAWQRVRRSRAPIGGLLMDQSVLAGVGNVYRAEVLFRHRLRPAAPRAHPAGRPVAGGVGRPGRADGRRACAPAGSRRVRPEHRAAARAARRARRRTGQHYVYRRDGQACLVCGAPCAPSELGGTNLFWCPRCQPVFRSRAVG